MSTKLNEFIANCTTNPPANQTEIEKIKSYIKCELPTSYISMLMFTDGFKGFVSNGSFLQIWKSSEVVNLNEKYNAKEDFPGMLIIGSDGAEEAIIIDIRNDSPTFGQYYMVPFESSDWKYSKMFGPNIEDIKIIY